MTNQLNEPNRSNTCLAVAFALCLDRPSLNKAWNAHVSVRDSYVH